MSLLLFLPTGNKEINKGLYSGTSSFSVSADSVSPNRAVGYVHLSDGWRIQSICLPRPLSLTDREMSHLRCTVAGCSALFHQRQESKARGRGPLCVYNVSALNQSRFCGQIWPQILTNKRIAGRGHRDLASGQNCQRGPFGFPMYSSCSFPPFQQLCNFHQNEDLIE